MKKQVYLITKNGRGYTTYQKKEAISIAKKETAAIYRLSYAYYKDCGFVMDIPTFKIVGVVIPS